MADTTAKITNQVTTAVAAVVVQPQVEAKLSAVPAIVEALAPLIMAVANSNAAGPWYQSRAVWQAILGFVAAILGVVGFAFPAELQGQALIVVMAIIPTVTALLGLYSRYRAKKPLV